MSALIDDDLVEMVTAAVTREVVESNGKAPSTPESIARAALAVAEPAIVAKCAGAAHAAIDDEERGKGDAFERDLRTGVSVAVGAIRSLTKDTQS